MKLTHQIKLFLMTGSINTAVGYAIYAAGIVFFNLSAFFAVVWSYVLGVTFSYFMFRAFVFTEGERGWKSYAKFIPTYVTLFIINEALLFVLVNIESWNKLLAQAVVVPICAALSFVINRVFVFK